MKPKLVLTTDCMLHSDPKFHAAEPAPNRFSE
jgi:hypothetical protein